MRNLVDNLVDTRMFDNRRKKGAPATHAAGRGSPCFDPLIRVIDGADAGTDARIPPWRHEFMVQSNAR